MKSKHLFTFYRIFNSLFVLGVRILFYLLFFILFFEHRSQYISFDALLSIYFIFLANEAFIFFGINKSLPVSSVDQYEDFHDVLLNRVRIQALHAKSGFELIMDYAHSSDARYVNLSIAHDFVLKDTQVAKDALIAKAGDLVKQSKGLYVSFFDLYVAYILLSEHETKVLQTNDVLIDDFMEFYKVVRRRVVVEIPHNLVFSGNGAFDFFIYGWNREISQYSWNITESIANERHEASIELRKSEYEQFLVALSKSSSANVILKGEAGTGKTNLIKYFAHQSHLGNVPSNLAKKVVFEVLIDRLLAGVENQGDLSSRLETLFEDLSHSGNAIVFIQNIENIAGGGGFGFDSSGMLFEYLKSNRVQIVGTTTNSGYAEYFENKEGIASLFEVVSIPSMSQNDAKTVLFEEMGKIEAESSVKLTIPSLTTVARFASAFYPTRALPGSAIDLLNDAVSALGVKNKRYLEKSDVEEIVQKRTHIAIVDPTSDEKDKLLHLEDAIHKRLINQEEAVKAVASAMRRVRSGFSNSNRPIATMLFLGPTGVGKTETAKALAQIYFGSEDTMIRLDMSELQSESSLIRILGEQKGSPHQDNSLVAQILEKPFSLILLDEFEKAHPNVLNIFLQVFEDGRLTSSKGDTISFQNSIIIATSNAGSEYIRKHLNEQNKKIQLLEYLLQNNLYKPELINRFDELIVFTPLSQEHVLQITSLMLKGALVSLEDEQIYVDYDQRVVEKVAQASYDPQFGARNMRRYIQREVEEFLSRLILENKFKKGEKYTLSVDGNGQFIINS